MLNRFLLALTALVLAVSSLGGAAQAQTVEWRFNNSYPASRPESVQIRAFAADVEKRTNGRMKISISEGGALGLKDADALRFMQTGAPELGFIWPPFLGRDAPALANIYVYGLVSGADEHLKALPALKAVLKEGIGKWNVEVPGFLGFSIVDASLFCREPVRSLDDLRKKKLRVGSREQVETFKRLGVAAQIVPQNELYSALQTGVVDGAENNPPTLLAQNHYTVTKVMSLTGHLIIPEIFVFSKKSWEGLSKEDQALVRKVSAEAQIEQRKLWDDYTREAETKLKGLGVQFVPADKPAFFKATQPIRDKYGAKYATLIKRIQDTK